MKRSMVGFAAFFAAGVGLAIGCGGGPAVVQSSDQAAEPLPSQGKTEPTAKPAATPVTTGTAPEVATGPTEWGIVGPEPAKAVDYPSVVARVESMIRDRNVMAGAQRRGLSVMNVMWEDTGRAQGSSVGPNISDLTLQVRFHDESGSYFKTALMPVIRFPNFTDRTGDIPADRFFVRVGNQKAGSQSIESVPLKDVLKDIRAFASVPSSILGNGNLLAPRDTHFLVSAQAVFLPIPKTGKAEFNPVIFNYQSAPKSPAVLTLLVTREGTSISVIENRREDMGMRGGGQELYFNNKGQRASFTAERRSDVKARIEAQGGPKTEAEKSALAKGADVLFLVQVPLVHAQRGVLGGSVPTMPAIEPKSGGAPMPMATATTKPSKTADLLPSEESDVEQAVLGHGPNLGPYNEGRNLRLVRDPKFPIRVTVQFYKATSNGVVNESDLDAIAQSIGSVYEHAEFVGSLVVPEGDPRRPTAWQTIPGEWFPW
ncbi:hypothetical protein [Polyangium jinanense]|uniref:Lipoprotein n=1 Tax=Polyangium jinanense TaxID=2829994 RepID=A0A9X3X6X8_9BACT|nr:hypothetical protein [Polyangium jinanense]MDC3958071.1 hypothetical protein [Polyangium jinanense]MDC3983730.1 hypothetical protein [Polyangium jinanense]